MPIRPIRAVTLLGFAVLAFFGFMVLDVYDHNARLTYAQRRSS